METNCLVIYILTLEIPTKLWYFSERPRLRPSTYLFIFLYHGNCAAPGQKYQPYVLFQTMIYICALFYPYPFSHDVIE